MVMLGLNRIKEIEMKKKKEMRFLWSKSLLRGLSAAVAAPHVSSRADNHDLLPSYFFFFIFIFLWLYKRLRYKEITPIVQIRMILRASRNLN